ncbi:MAG: 3-dehydroquinate synthase [Firmicutes bacterium]|nr:3-dehydroquinate synthase [Bacillota bacterium]
MKQKIIISTSLEQHLDDTVREIAPDRLFLLCDETTAALCLPKVKDFGCLKGAETIVIKAGDADKSLAAVSHVWEALQKGGATRHSLMINLGGGMVTDLGGFAASTFKRGIHFVNVPTTLLSLVDASAGGKTGINFGGLKNEIGVFNTADAVILDTQFLATLSNDEMRSGYAEMIKHGLIFTPRTAGDGPRERMLAELMTFDIFSPDLSRLRQMVAESVEVKERIVELDPLEHGLRKALNFGHTFGHAFESFGMARGQRAGGGRNKAVSPVPHGHAVAYGMVCELWLSCVKAGFPQDIMRRTVKFINACYGTMPVTCDDYETLYELMTHDKKNTAGTINFTLLSAIGEIEINRTATKEEIFEALDFYRENR